MYFDNKNQLNCWIKIFESIYHYILIYSLQFIRSFQYENGLGKFGIKDNQALRVIIEKRNKTSILSQILWIKPRFVNYIFAIT